jgi:hypothetical protein
VTKPEDMHPTSDAEVFEMLHGLFGIGDYNEDDPIPWHKARMVEIAKIKAIRTKRRWSFGDFAMVAVYCYHQSIRITKAWDLLQHHGKARLAQVNSDRLRRESRAQDAAALELQVGLPDSEEWAGRLSRATGRGREELLAEWESTRKRTLEEAM